MFNSSLAIWVNHIAFALRLGSSAVVVSKPGKTRCSLNHLFTRTRYPDASGKSRVRFYAIVDNLRASVTYGQLYALLSGQVMEAHRCAPQSCVLRDDS